jgi:hypothetical protein
MHMRTPALRGLALGAALGLAGPLHAEPAPTIRLFPTTVVEEIKHTGSVARQMESGLQPIIRRLDEQQQLYRESKCDGASADPGCEQLARQLGETYLEMLRVMSDRLPDMERAVNATRKTLRGRLKRELGQKRTSWEVQEWLVGRSAGETASGTRSLARGRSGMRLSDRFRQYYKLVARPGASADSSLAVIAADIYLDLEETSVLIARTREEINRATLMEELHQSLGTITPEMLAVVDGVKAVLFGEDALAPPVDAAPVQAAEQAYTSPLEM